MLSTVVFFSPYYSDVWLYVRQRLFHYSSIKRTHFFLIENGSESTQSSKYIDDYEPTLHSDQNYKVVLNV